MKKNNIEQCKITLIHKDIVKVVKDEMPNESILYNLAEIFKVFGDTTRIKIIYSLFRNEMCVCDMAALIGTTQSAISHQLRVLKESKLVKYRKEGKIVYYSLDDEHVESILNEGLKHVLE